MKLLSFTAIALVLCASTVLAQNTVNVPSDRQVQQPIAPNSAPNQAQQNPMPGASGGFNNNEINGKSRNPNSTTPGTGPANADTNLKQ
jgi:hypothetical protein